MKQDHLYSASLPSQSLLQNQKFVQYLLEQHIKLNHYQFTNKKCIKIARERFTSVHQINSVANLFIEEDREIYT